MDEPEAWAGAAIITERGDRYGGEALASMGGARRRRRWITGLLRMERGQAGGAIAVALVTRDAR
jgi:hypothetical protein